VKRVFLLIMLMGVIVLSGTMLTAKTRVNFIMARYHTGVTDDYCAKLAQDFEAVNPDIDMRIEVINWDNLHMKLTTMLGAGNAPELAVIDTPWILDYIANDVAEPLDKYMTSGFRSEFIPSLINTLQIKGKLYGIPIAASSRAMYYLKDALAQAGMESPKTWDELVKVAKAVHNPPNLYGFGIPCTTFEGGAYYSYFLWAAGEEWFDKVGKLVIDSPEGIEALQFMVDLVNKYKVTNPEPAAINRDEMQKVFTQGRIGMFITGPWLTQMITNENPELSYGIASIPAYRKEITMAVVDTLMMFKNAKNKEAAWKFVEFAYQDKYRLEFDEKEGMLPEKKAVAEQIAKANPIMKTFIDVLPYGKFYPPLHSNWKEIVLETIKNMQLAYMGEKTPKEALEDTCKEINPRIILGF